MLNTPFKIGKCQVTPSEFTLQFEDESKQSLQPKFIEVLCYLAKYHPRVIPRSELIDNIWGSDSYVGDKSLTNAIWHLRKNLTLANGNEEVIETIRKAGYRLLVKPQWQENADEKSAVDVNEHQNTKQHNHNKISFKKLQSFIVSIVLILLIVSYVYYQKVPTQQETISLITQHPGSELFPSPSPDGRFIAYSQISINKPNNIFIKDTLQPELAPKQLTFDQALEGHSAWSNDGKYLYFSRKDKLKKICHYVQLHVQSHQEKYLADCPMSGRYYYLDISVDDQTLAINSFRKGDNESGIYLVDLTNLESHPKRFSCNKKCNYKDRDMAFSPDGKFIAVTRRINRFNENVHLVNLADNSSEQLTFGEEDIVGLSWHPDNKKIVYATRRAGVRNGFVFDIDNKTTKALNLAGFSYPNFAKKSKQLYFQQREENYYLASLQLNSTIAQSPTPVVQSTFNHTDPDYNSENKRVAYISNESGFDELWSTNVDGSERHQLTHLKKNIRYPEWSHNGNKIAFLAKNNHEAGDSIYIYSLKNKNLTVLPSPFTQHNRPSWSWNDDKIISAIYGDKFTDLFSISITDGLTERLTFDGGRYGVMESPASLIYTKTKKGLWQKKITNHQSSKNIISGTDFNTRYSWSYHNDKVYFHKADEDHHQIVVYNFDKKITTPLVRLPLNSFSSNDALTYITEHNQLLYTGVNYPQANIKMIANSPLFK